MFGKRDYAEFARKKNQSYDPTKLLSGLQNKVSQRSIQAIQQAIQFQIAHGARLAINQLKIPKGQEKRFKGKFINFGTFKTLASVNVDKVKSIQQKYLDDLKLLVARAVGGGTITWNHLVKEIKRLGNLSDSHAEMIARTEVIRTVTAGMGDMYRNNGIKKWRWISTIDDRTSDICRALDNKVVEIGQPFANWQYGPIYKPPAHPNCRSGVEPVV